VLAATDSGGLFRFANGSWTPLGNVDAQTGDPGDVVDTSGAVINGELNTLAVHAPGLPGGLYVRTSS
jgi:hypothetical protein